MKRYVEVSLGFGKVYLAEVLDICFFLHLPDLWKRFVELNPRFKTSNKPSLDTCAKLLQQSNVTQLSITLKKIGHCSHYIFLIKCQLFSMILCIDETIACDT